MPHYDYKCSDCKKDYEIFQKMSDDPLSICPSCGGKLKRLIGKGAGPIFKGSGFYQTDYKNTPDKKKENKTSSEKKPEESKIKGDASSAKSAAKDDSPA